MPEYRLEGSPAWPSGNLLSPLCGVRGCARRPPHHCRHTAREACHWHCQVHARPATVRSASLVFLGSLVMTSTSTAWSMTTVCTPPRRVCRACQRGGRPSLAQLHEEGDGTSRNRTKKGGHHTHARPRALPECGDSLCVRAPRGEARGAARELEGSRQSKRKSLYSQGGPWHPALPSSGGRGQGRPRRGPAQRPGMLMSRPLAPCGR